MIMMIFSSLCGMVLSFELVECIGEWTMQMLFYHRFMYNLQGASGQNLAKANGLAVVVQGLW